MNTKFKCRCCLARPPDRDLKSKNVWLGETEIYNDMLKECFEIQIAIGKLPGDDGICDSCVSALRNAVTFKKQVLQCQREFDVCSLNYSDVKDEIPKVKLEVIDDANYLLDLKSEPHEMAACDLDDDDDDDDKNLALLAIEQISKFSRDITVTRKRKAGSNSTKNKIKKSSALSKDVYAPRIKLVASKMRYRDEATKHKINIETLLKYTNATVFSGKTLTGYTCAFCKSNLTTADELREHFKGCHTKKTLVNKKRTDDLNTKIDITDFKCTLCSQQVDSVRSMKFHLVQDHGLKLYMDIHDYVLEFKLTDEEMQACALCSASFETFKMLLQHMNLHYRNFICDICDMGYINLNKLKNHKRTHETGSAKCSYCDKVFTNNIKRNLHEKFIHKTKTLARKCPHCDETFTNYYQRNRHMVNDHNISAASYKCTICDKNFLMKSKLTFHIKKVHLMERDHICPECGHGFFMKQYLEEHMIKHKGERIHKCDVCNKAYARKKTLREHMRIHNNDRRFKCGVCGLAFVQKCSLKSHMLSNHGIALSEYENAVDESSSRIVANKV